VKIKCKQSAGISKHKIKDWLATCKALLFKLEKAVSFYKNEKY
jgi:hypothetical protein